MGKIEDLAHHYGRHICATWSKTIAGAQRVVIVVYDKHLERTLRARLGEFIPQTIAAQRRWIEIDLTNCFAAWMSAIDYRDAYFENPDDLAMKLEGEFFPHVAGQIRAALHAADETTVVAVVGLASLFGFVHVSQVVRAVEADIRGRLVLFFPGSKDGNNYRLLDARDGWNYLAQCITLHGFGGTS